MKTIWSQNLGNPECTYLRRWVLDFGWFAIRLHHWISSDDQRAPHDHPWWYFSICLWGSYVDRSIKDVLMFPLRMIFRRSDHQHTVKVHPRGCWTLLITGPEKRVWGFWVNGRFRKRNKYFYEHGHHPCEEK